MNPMHMPGTDPVAVLVCRAGQLPIGADEAVAEVGGLAVVAGQGSRDAAAQLTTAHRVWTVETGSGLQVARLTRRLAELVALSPLVVLPASADGRDLAPRLAAALDRPLLAGAVSVGVVDAPVGETPRCSPRWCGSTTGCRCRCADRPRWWPPCRRGCVR